MAEVRKLTMTYKIISAFSLTSWSKSILQYPPTSHYIHGLGCLFFFSFSFYSWAGKSSPISKFSSQKCGPAVYEAQKNVSLTTLTRVLYHLLDLGQTVLVLWNLVKVQDVQLTHFPRLSSKDNLGREK